MDKSNKNLLFIRNLTNKSTINQLSTIVRCKKCNKYNNNNEPKKKKLLCNFCGNPILINGKDR